MYHGERLKIYKYGIEWDSWYYLYWWNYLPKKYHYTSVETGEVTEGKPVRYWGFGREYYEGPHHHFGFWFFNISWRFPWTPW